MGLLNGTSSNYGFEDLTPEAIREIKNCMQNLAWGIQGVINKHPVLYSEYNGSVMFSVGMRTSWDDPRLGDALEAVRDTVCRILQKSGFSIEDAEDAAYGELDFFRNGSKKCLVFKDLTIDLIAAYVAV